MNAAEQLIQQGLQQGLRNAIVTILSVRGITWSTLGQGRLASCVNADTLNGWLARAGTASSEVEVFGDAEGR